MPEIQLKRGTKKKKKTMQKVYYDLIGRHTEVSVRLHGIMMQIRISSGLLADAQCSKSAWSEAKGRHANEMV